MERRLFIAVKYSATTEFLSLLNKIQNEINHTASLKWVEWNNLHLTIQFLGNTSDSSMPIITNSVKVIANETNPFTVSIIGAGIFHSIQNPRVLWLGIEPTNHLFSIHQQLQKQFISGCNEQNDNRLLNQINENSKFTPHLPLGRFKKVNDTRKLKHIVEKYEQQTFDNWLINEIILFESILTPKGPIYRPLITSKFKQ